MIVQKQPNLSSQTFEEDAIFIRKGFHKFFWKKYLIFPYFTYFLLFICQIKYFFICIKIIECVVLRILRDMKVEKSMYIVRSIEMHYSARCRGVHGWIKEIDWSWSERYSWKKVQKREKNGNYSVISQRIKWKNSFFSIMFLR